MGTKKKLGRKQNANPALLSPDENDDDFQDRIKLSGEIPKTTKRKRLPGAPEINLSPKEKLRKANQLADLAREYERIQINIEILLINIARVNKELAEIEAFENDTRLVKEADDNRRLLMLELRHYENELDRLIQFMKSERLKEIEREVKAIDKMIKDLNEVISTSTYNIIRINSEISDIVKQLSTSEFKIYATILAGIPQEHWKGTPPPDGTAELSCLLSCDRFGVAVNAMFDNVAELTTQAVAEASAILHGDIPMMVDSDWTEKLKVKYSDHVQEEHVEHHVERHKKSEKYKRDYDNEVNHLRAKLSEASGLITDKLHIRAKQEEIIRQAKNDVARCEGVKKDLVAEASVLDQVSVADSSHKKVMNSSGSVVDSAFLKKPQRASIQAGRGAHALQSSRYNSEHNSEFFGSAINPINARTPTRIVSAGISGRQALDDLYDDKPIKEEPSSNEQDTPTPSPTNKKSGP